MPYVHNQQIKGRSHDAKKLFSDEGREVTKKLINEAWYQIMLHSNHRVYQRLGAQILVCAALDKINPRRVMVRAKVK